ncbi:MAG TPA: alpha/beta hydrolase [Thermoanaerobaculia bacterium]
MILVLALVLSNAVVPRYERVPCAAEVATDERIECGALIVPENRAKKDSRAIRLPAMVFRSRAEKPAPDPLVFVTGGPGNSNTSGKRSGKDLPFLDQRDFILLEQRGAKLAEPALECPEINRVRGEIAAGKLPDAAMIDAAKACRAALVASGVDLDGYTSIQSADDLEDLRRLLGYGPWNLHGVSYGSRMILTYLRRHPASVRSVVLDSVLPPEVNFDEVSAINLLRSLNVMFDACAVDRECGAAHPALRRQFAELVARADREPLPLGVEANVRGAQVVDAIYSALHNPHAIPMIPRVIASAANGNYTALQQLVRENLGPSRSTWGLRLSVWCSEEMPFEDPQRVASQVSPALGLGGIDEGAATPALCRTWNVAPAPAVENEPVQSDVPALIFSGEFDPDTPPEWGRRLLDAMPNARFVEFRGRSHGAGFNACGAGIVAAFLRDPRAPLAADCALRTRGARFGK